LREGAKPSFSSGGKERKTRKRRKDIKIGATDQKVRPFCRRKMPKGKWSAPPKKGLNGIHQENPRRWVGDPRQETAWLKKKMSPDVVLEKQGGGAPAHGHTAIRVNGTDESKTAGTDCKRNKKKLGGRAKRPWGKSQERVKGNQGKSRHSSDGRR